MVSQLCSSPNTKASWSTRSFKNRSVLEYWSFDYQSYRESKNRKSEVTRLKKKLGRYWWSVASWKPILHTKIYLDGANSWTSLWSISKVPWYRENLRADCLKYYWPTLKVNNKSYITGCNIYLASKLVKHKLYGDLRFFLVLTYW